MRPLTLHASALNDDEYDLYTTSLNDLAWADDTDSGQAHDDAYYEQMKIGIREARGWLRGRYAHLPPGAIDSILRFFSPDLSQSDVLTGGQFFAGLRLAVHAENGKDIDRALAFVQAHPSTSASAKRPSVDVVSPRDFGQPPPTPSSSGRAFDTPTSTPSMSSNPFSAAHPPVHPTQRSDPHKSPHAVHNPFARPSGDVLRPPLPPRKIAPPIPLIPPPKHGSTLLSPSSRKSASPTRPSPTSIAPAHSHTPPSIPPHPPVPPKPAHVTSTLMKQSLQASKAAQTMKRAEAQLEQERVLQVLKSSAVVSGGYSLAGARVSRSPVVIGTQVRTSYNRSVSPNKVVVNAQGPLEATFHQTGSASMSTSDSSEEGRGRERRAPPLPRRRNTHTQQQPSPPVSISSLEQVALAQTSGEVTSPLPVRSTTNPFPRPADNNPFHRPLPDPHPTKPYTSSPHTSPAHPTTDLPSTRPPTHPDRKPPFTSSLFHNPSPFTSPTQNVHPTLMSTTNSMTTPESSPTARVFRSKSLHHPSPPLPPLPGPPPRRKRPESVQVLGSPASSVFGDGAEVVPYYGTPERERGVGMGRPVAGSGTLSRHTSFSTPSHAHTHRRQSSLSAASMATYSTSRSDGAGGGPVAGGESPLSKLARSWQPRLEKARYKAEAGLSRRGYVRDVRSRSRGREGEGEEKEELIQVGGGEEGWGGQMRGAKGRGYGYGSGGGEEYEPPSVDGLSLDGSTVSVSDEEGEGRSRRGGREGVERDGLKWPVVEGEGWRPL
ncbi:hypothetical protein FPV67DRAFT_1456628 [Lyophyllum atratum]|nr:hypothetical protein FPV67DRAFT_1456628 [Lyophyllum atratum]